MKHCTASLAFMAAISLAPAAAVRAQESSEDEAEDITSKFAINDADPVSSVPTPEQAMRSPLDMGYHVMLLTERADAATKKGDHLAAARYWAALAKAAPDAAMPNAKMCAEYEAAGEIAKAIENCRSALGKPGVTVADHLHYVKLLIEKKKGQLSQLDIGDIVAIAEYLDLQLGGERGALTSAEVYCQLGARQGDVERLKDCTAKLEKLAPKEPQTLLYRWELAMEQGELSKAETLLKQAAEFNLSGEVLDQLTARLSAEHERRKPWFLKPRDPRTIASVSALLGLLAGVYALRSRRREQFAEN